MKIVPKHRCAVGVSGRLLIATEVVLELLWQSGLASGVRGNRRYRAITQIGSDRLIATARVLVSALLLIAIWLDPTQPAVRWEIAYALLSGYLVLSLIVVGLEYQHALEIPESVRRLLHAVDILFITALVYFTQGTTQSVFGFFAYLIVVSHVRWRWKGTLATSVVVLLGYCFMMLISPATMGAGIGATEGNTDLDGIIVRVGYLGTVAAILIYVGYAQEIATAKMLRAADWPIVMSPADALPAFLEHAGKVLGTPEAAMLWFPESEAAAELFMWSNGNLRSRKWPRDVIEARLNRDGTVLLFHWRGYSQKTVLVSAEERRLVETPPFPDRLLRVCGPAAMLGIWFEARSGYGCLLCRREQLEADDFVLAQIIADRFRTWADQAELYREVEGARWRDQQVELARDLHDTVLQALAGISLQMQSIVPRIATAYPDVAERIEGLVHTLGREQVMLRSRLHALASETTSEATEPVLIERRLAELERLVEARWELAVDWKVEPSLAVISTALDRQLMHILLEAAANAKKHSHAFRLTIRVFATPGEIEVVVGNDRREPVGPFGSRPTTFDPKMLRSRVEDLGGSLSVNANPTNVDLQIVLPARARSHG